MSELIKPIDRIITPLDELTAFIADHMRQIKGHIAQPTRTTIIVRHGTHDNADIMLSEETDLDHLIAAINRLKERRLKK